MPIPLTYPSNIKSEFELSGRPPTPVQYTAPTLARTEFVLDRPRISWMSDSVRNHIVAMIGEFLGTLSFLFFGLAAVQVANSKPDTLLRIDASSGAPSLLQIVYISGSFGISLTVNVWVFYRVSGGMFNPAVTFGLCLAGAVPWVRGALLVPVQLLASVAASLLVSTLLPGYFNTQANTGAGVSPVQALFLEMILTCQLVFTVLMLAVEKHRASFAAPLGIGLAVFLAALVGGSFSGACLNPARSFGPDVVLMDFKSYHWIYWAGPILGAVNAVGIYKTLKLLEYTTANPGQDDDGLDIYRVVSGRQKVHHQRRGSIESYSSQNPLGYA
ncbi:aquaporin-2 [Diplocarpon mali]|nr:aquaporin-2 [Diplocarpon mali]